MEPARGIRLLLKFFQSIVAITGLIMGTLCLEKTMVAIENSEVSQNKVPNMKNSINSVNISAKSYAEQLNNETKQEISHLYAQVIDLENAMKYRRIHPISKKHHNKPLKIISSKIHNVFDSKTSLLEAADNITVIQKEISNIKIGIQNLKNESNQKKTKKKSDFIHKKLEKKKKG